ncbi:hypothetical protein DNU06_16230 [Putridiphycobacter roseus]|uniref:Uncharacterized protein n=2 Tax=Putridiphycobacter roseus TaxID=2219161 RepID=A0A2W1MUT4_9FLAO|nr:hypothetical protein DNU06_16230 [Putridiphycobacter roseus]
MPSLIVYGQTDCKNDVNTDFTNPSNNALPSIDGSQYLNGFDWFPIVGGIYDEYQTTNISFGGVTIPEMNSIMTAAYMHYRYIWDGPLPLRENGWELLLVNLGRYPDDITTITVGNSQGTKPYIVLYNRYSATIRVFVNYGLDNTVGNGANDMLIQLTFEDPTSEEINGNLRLYDGHDQALGDSTTITSVSSVVLAPAEGQNWASADFKISYDPCVCYRPSKLRFDFEQIAQTNIQLHGRSITLPDEPLINGNLGTDLTEFLNGFVFARKYTTTLASIPDYVFEPDYKLLTFDELRVYIEENKHLPNIPSAEQYEETGVDLGELNRLLLEKVEELTLYTLQLEERLSKLEEEK